jgi:hypothetical protein
MSSHFCIKDGYRARTEARYFDDRPYADADIVHQPDAYPLAAFVAARYGADTIIDVGCGSARKLMALHGVRKVGIDFGDNLIHCRQMFPSETWIDADFERIEDGLIDDALAARSVVVCADVIEHLVDPGRLLDWLSRLSRRARAVIITTPERDRVRGIDDAGPPGNPSHVREWNLPELEQLLTQHGLAPTFIGLTVNNNVDLEKKTILALIDHAANEARALPLPADFRPLALIATYNDADIIEEIAVTLLDDGFDVHMIDNWSDDGGFESLTALRQRYRGLSVERFPADAPAQHYEWETILDRKSAIAAAHPGRWIVHQDSDEIRQSPWSGVSFRHGLAIADRMGCNAVDFTVCDFRPLDDKFGPGDPLERTLTHFEFGKRAGHFSQVKAWKQGTQPVALAASGGHNVAFAGRRVFPYKFLLRHYPLRSPQQARKKIFTERVARFSPRERAKGWHVQYDGLPPDAPFLWSGGLVAFDPVATRRDHLVELISGIGIVR